MRHPFHLYTVLAWIALGGVGAGAARAESILIDFGSQRFATEVDERGRRWNDATDIKQLQLELVTERGTATGLVLEVVEPFEKNVLPPSDDIVAIYPAKALDRWLASMAGSKSGVLRLRGLKPDQRVDLYFFASTRPPPEGKAPKFFSQFQAGGRKVLLNIEGNVDKRAVLEGVQPEADGSILITVNGPDEGPGQGTIGVMEIVLSGEGGVPIQKSAPTPAPVTKVPSAREPDPVRPAPAPVVQAPAPTPVPAPAPAVPGTPRPGVVEEGEGGVGMRVVIGGILLALGLGVAGFVIWSNLKK